MALGKIPKPYRRKNHRGKEFGSYYCKVRGEEINLACQDPDEAYRRAAAAKRDGKRNFKADAEAAAAAAIEARTKPIPPPTPPDELAAARAAAAAAAATAAAESAQPRATSDPPARPAATPAEIPPRPDPTPSPVPPATPAREPNATNEAPGHERVEEAAREATQQRDSTEAPPPPPPPPGMQFDPAFLDMIAKQGARTIVDLQLMLQAWIVFKRTGDKPGKVPPEASAFPVQLWEHQLKIWVARWNFDLPPWAIALFLTSMCYPLQHATRTKPAPKGNLGSVVDAEWAETQRKAA
jgi:hypothetical protein